MAFPAGVLLMYLPEEHAFRWGWSMLVCVYCMLVCNTMLR
jgi:hypothetical protein